MFYSLLSFSTSSNDSDLIQKQIKETISTPMDIVESSRSLSVPLKSPVEQLLIHGVPVDPERALKISGIAVEVFKYMTEYLIS